MEKYTAASVRQMKSGKWQARLRYKDDGKWKNLDRMLPEAKGKREATKMAEDLRRELNEVAEKTQMNNRTITAVVQSYLDFQYSSGVIERSTYDDQCYILNKRIAPYIGNYIFDTLDRTAIIAWHTKLSAEGIAQATIRNYFRVMTKVYAYYESIGEITKNPFKTVRMPQSKSNRITHMTSQEMNAFLAAVYSEYELGDRMLTAILLAYYCGLRRGECCALRWSDIDFEANTITVSSNIGSSADGYYTKNPKNNSSHRTFPMVPQIVEVLKARRDKVKPQKNWYVVGDEKFFAPGWFYQQFIAFVKAYDLKDAYGKYLTIHSLRHNFATTGVKSGMDISALSAMLGHSSMAMTLDRYADASEESKTVGAKRLADAFAKTDLDT